MEGRGLNYLSSITTQWVKVMFGDRRAPWAMADLLEGDGGDGGVCYTLKPIVMKA